MLNQPRRFAGFADESRESQAAFRAAMMALAEPGTLHTLSCLPDAPAAIPPAFAALVLTLLDKDTPVWCSADLRENSDFIEFLTFHTHAPLLEQPAQARFVLVGQAMACPPLASLAQGDPAYPDTSATLIIAVKQLEGGAPALFEGPGIKGDKLIAPQSLAPDFWMQWDINAASYPQGVDIFFCCGPELIGLPRSSKRSHPGV